MKTAIMVATFAATGADAGAVTPKMDGARLQAGSTCYAIVAGDKTIGSTLQTITASRDGARPVWDIVVHQKLANGTFDMRDHFIVDRKTLLPIRMDSQRGRERTERGWHRVSVEYGPRNVRGTMETATGSTPLDAALTAPTWDGNLWGLTFAALPLKEGGTYAVPFWQYDKGFGTFTARVVGSETVEAPSGKIAAWVVEAGNDPAQLARYKIAKATRQELGYAAGPSGQRLRGLPLMSGDLPDFRTRASLRDDLTRIGLRADDTVMAHAAMSKVGPLLNGPDALSNAILDVVGPDGTMLVYTSWDSVHDDLLDDDGRVLPEWRDHVPGFDRQASRAVRMNGIIAEFVRTMPGAQRSANPGASVAAVGKLAEWITADHGLDWGFGENTPLSKLVGISGRVLMVGAPWDTMTLVHHADHVADIADKRTIRIEVPFAGANGTEWRFMEEFETGDPVHQDLPENYIERIVTAYVESGGRSQGAINAAPSLLVDARPMFAFAIRWLETWAVQHGVTRIGAA